MQYPTTLPDLARLLDRQYAFPRVLLVRSAVTGPFLDNMLDPAQPRENKRLIRYAAHTSPSLPPANPQNTFDFIALDPWHTFAQSQHDLAAVAARLDEYGVLLCHDCNPPCLEVCSAEYQTGLWCGVTYAALVDFVATHAQDGWMCAVLPQDFGVAILCRAKAFKRRQYPFVQPLAIDAETCALRQEFLQLFHSGDSTSSFAFYQKHASRMVNLLA